MTREQFIGELDNWCSHRPALWDALHHTEGKVIEFGMGDGSTLQLHNYCAEYSRVIRSYDSDIEWVDKFKWLQDENHAIRHKLNWDDTDLYCGLLFIDHAPGERRRIDIERAAFTAQIIVAHDTEPSADHGYQMRDILKMFPYMKDYETPGAWTTVVSNFIDVTKF